MKVKVIPGYLLLGAAESQRVQIFMQYFGMKINKKLTMN